MKAPGLLLSAVVAASGCAPRVVPPDPARLALLKQTYDHLHERLEKASATDPVLSSAFAEKGQIVLAIRSGLIEDLAGSVARRYLDKVTVDLKDVDAHGGGELKRKTLLGRVKVGEWNVNVDIGALEGNLQAGAPRVGLRAPNLIDVDVPVDVQETEGDATLHFSWDSAGIANVVCKDFEITRTIRGRVLRQQHSLVGALSLANTGEELTAAPVFPNRRVQLKLDLTPKSWATVEAALRTQDTAGKCGILMDPDKGVERLRELAARGINVKLPDSMFRTVSLPARVQKSVKVNQRVIELAVEARSLRVEGSTLWSSASIQVVSARKPASPQPEPPSADSRKIPLATLLHPGAKPTPTPSSR